MNRSNRYRSIFWPLLLIGFGAIWLMVNLGFLPGWSWSELWRLWPLFLIAIGLDLLIARRSAIIGALVALVTLVLIIVVILIGGFFGYSSNRVEVITEQFSEPIGAAESAEIELDLSVGPSTVGPLHDDNLLIDAQITHIGVMDFVVTGTRSKNIQLDEQQVKLDFGLLDVVDRDELEWDVAITPLVPVSLEVRGGVGETELLLADLLLEELVVDVGIGDISLTLPAHGEAYRVHLDGGVGETGIDIERGANVTLVINGSVGDVRIDVPTNAEVRVDASTGVGSVRLPSRFSRLSESEDNVVGESGIWETSGYADAEVRITITFDGGVGNFIVR